MRGSKTPLVLVPGLQELADAIPSSDLRVLGGRGHLSTLERPEEVSSSLREWLVRAEV